MVEADGTVGRWMVLLRGGVVASPGVGGVVWCEGDGEGGKANDVDGSIIDVASARSSCRRLIDMDVEEINLRSTIGLGMPGGGWNEVSI